MNINKNAEIHTTADGVYYDIFQGGYLHPEEYLSGEELQKVQDAIETVGIFVQELENNDLIDYI